jgi:tight adherence protein B
VTPAILGLIAFVAIALGAAAVMLVVRDLAASAAAGRAQRGAAVFRLARLPLARDQREPRSAIEQFDQWFLRLLHDAGSDWSPVTAVLYLLLFALLIGGALFVITDMAFVGGLGAVIGTAIAFITLIMARARRARQLQEQLPAALEMLARAVRAGESLEQAVELVGEKSPEPLAREFRRVANQLHMGLSISAAMRALVFRVRMMDMRIFTTTLTVHRRTGGNLAATLERLAAVVRERLTYRRQMRAATGAGRVSAMIIAMVGPLLFAYLFLFHPDYVQGLVVDPIGRSLLIVAVFLEIVGLLWISRLLRTDD